MEIINKSRKAWLDCLRAIAIIMVVLGHQIPKEIDYFVYTSALKMPLFFAISGYLFKYDIDWKGFLKNISVKLIFPWLILGFINILPCLRKGDLHLFVENFIKLINGNILWFMPCLIIGEIILYFICKSCKSFFRIGISCSIIAILGITIHHYGYLNEMMFNRAMVVQIYFFLGLIIRKYEHIFKQVKTYWIILTVILYVALCFTGTIIYPNQSIDVHLNRYFNLSFCFTLIVLGVTSCFTLFSRFNISSNLFTYIGQNTLILYIFHGWVIALSWMVLNKLGIEVHNVWIKGIISTIFAIIGCGILSYFINKHCPFIVGKKRK